MKNLYSENSLSFDPSLCTGCKMCTNVCPHAVFEMKDKRAVLKNKSACMECGACQLNCASNAIRVESGTGCAAAMIWQSITGSELATCGPKDSEKQEQVLKLKKQTCSGNCS